MGRSDHKWFLELMLLKFEVGLFLDCGVHPYKHLWIFQKGPAAWIWDFLTFNICYLGPLAKNFRSLSLFLRKLELFCWGWLEKFCLVVKMQHFLPYLKTQVKSSFGLDNFINITWSINIFLQKMVFIQALDDR